MSDEMNPASDGIEVDDAAAYFGVTQSSDVLHAMMAMPQEQAMVQFFELLSDIVLRPGEFDFEAASERMQCEGGEIYYLVAGHLGLMSMPDPLLQALGMPDSSGETAAASAAVSDGQRAPLEALANPMRMMKLFAAAHQTGGKDEVLNYMSRLQSMLSNIDGSIEALVNINSELDAALDVAGHVLPIPPLASGAASAATVDVPETTALPTPPAEAAPHVDAPRTARAAPDRSTNASGAQRAHPCTFGRPPGGVGCVARIHSRSPRSSNRSTSKVKNKLQRPRKTHFQGPSVQNLVPEPEPAQVVHESNAASDDDAEFVSAAEHFIAADEDGSGALDVEELAQATGTTIEEATALHAEADTDGDGVVSLSEFISSPAAEKTASLPKPVAPVRRPLGQRQPTQPSAPVQATPPQPPQQQWQQQPPQARLASAITSTGLAAAATAAARLAAWPHATASTVGATHHSFRRSLPELRDWT